MNYNIPESIKINLFSFILSIVFLMLVLDFQVNLINDSLIKIIYDAIIVLLIGVILLINISARHVIFVIMFFLIGWLVDDFLKIIYMSFVMFYGFLFTSKYANKLNSLVFCVSCINLLVMLLQISGHFPILYSFQNYYNPEKNIIDIFNYNGEGFIALTQLRPPGIFPSNIYLSLFELFLAAYYFLNNKNVKIYYIFVLAMIFVFSGSTLSYVLLVTILLLSENVTKASMLLLFSLVGIVLYMLLLPFEFVEYNYSFDSLISSFKSRLITSNTGNNNSVFLIFKYYLLGSVGALVLFLNYFSDINYRKIIFIVILALAPLIIQPSIFINFYWFYMGCIIGQVYLNKNNVFLEKLRQTSSSFNR